MTTMSDPTADLISLIEKVATAQITSTSRSQAFEDQGLPIKKRRLDSATVAADKKVNPPSSSSMDMEVMDHSPRIDLWFDNLRCAENVNAQDSFMEIEANKNGKQNVDDKKGKQNVDDKKGKQKNGKQNVDDKKGKQKVADKISENCTMIFQLRGSRENGDDDDWAPLFFGQRWQKPSKNKRLRGDDCLATEHDSSYHSFLGFSWEHMFDKELSESDTNSLVLPMSRFVLPMRAIHYFPGVMEGGHVMLGDHLMLAFSDEEETQWTKNLVASELVSFYRKCDNPNVLMIRFTTLSATNLV